MHRRRRCPQQPQQRLRHIGLELVLVPVLVPLLEEVRHASCCLCVNRPRCGCNMRCILSAVCRGGRRRGGGRRNRLGHHYGGVGGGGVSRCCASDHQPWRICGGPIAAEKRWALLHYVESCLRGQQGDFSVFRIAVVDGVRGMLCASPPRSTNAVSGPSPSAASPLARVGSGSTQSPTTGTPAAAPVASPAAVAKSSPAVAKPPATPAPESVAAPATGSGPFGTVPLVLAAVGALVLGTIAWVVLSPQSRTGEEL